MVHVQCQQVGRKAFSTVYFFEWTYHSEKLRGSELIAGRLGKHIWKASQDGKSKPNIGCLEIFRKWGTKVLQLLYAMSSRWNNGKINLMGQLWSVLSLFSAALPEYGIKTQYRHIFRLKWLGGKKRDRDIPTKKIHIIRKKLFVLTANGLKLIVQKRERHETCLVTVKGYKIYILSAKLKQSHHRASNSKTNLLVLYYFIHFTLSTTLKCFHF